MNFSVIDRQEAPVRGPERVRRRIAGMDDLVAALVPGKAVRIELAEDEKPRPLVEQLFRAASQAGKIVDVWDVDGVLYAELTERSPS